MPQTANAYAGNEDKESANREYVKHNESTALTVVFKSTMKSNARTDNSQGNYNSYSNANKQRDNNTSGDHNSPTSHSTPPFSGRIPRISKQMALAIHLQKLIDTGAIRDYAELARITGLSRARITQIMNLNLLAPRIQEELLFLPRVVSGKAKINEQSLRPITMESRWDLQMKERRKWSSSQ